ncbi:Na+/H+ antiporter NhaA [Mixta tenebrionis]|uniref:Na(+)/H(+) antiporter NhaA n=1 Tax=Mixta tenebrionis TaxID=2562439 RepID=A0A506VEG9_9GAMM|nr:MULTISPECIES: Na+/H+ antiporter NhaA [Mixta]QHM76758.1 Na(+)/H(+) antiporter NhaA [Mixta theicola]TPW43826.1 Na+/H+ antiporter NhaA [Mixta tenebrionis]
MVKRFFTSEASGGMVLIAAAAMAMLLANLASTQHLYSSLLAMPVEFRFGELHINKNLLLWINDALMAVFFLAIGLEVKREMVSGALASREKAMFPLIAALGGMLAPGLIFLLLNGSDAAVRSGWAVPTATDIAFALGVLALLGSRVPPALKIFLMALAIIDDLGAIVIIALFYTHGLSLLSLIIAAAAIIVLALLNRFNVRRTSVYMLVGAILWIAVLKSGVHATLAGVIVGFFVPLAEKQGKSPARALEHGLHPWVTWLILPLFAFANAGVALDGVAPGDLFSLLPLGIILGLFIGKPLGITLFCWLGIKLGIARLPQGSSLGNIAATGVLCGIGFTMSIFIASLAYGELDAGLMVLAKLGILCGSLLSAVAGYLLLRSRLN